MTVRRVDRALVRRAIALSVACSATPASADDTPVAEPTEAEPIPMQRHVEHAGCGGRSGPRTITAARITGGALVGGPSRGGYGRVEVEGFRGSIRRPAPLVGVSILSIGGWADGRGSGVGTGTWLYAGYASPEVFGTSAWASIG